MSSYTAHIITVSLSYKCYISIYRTLLFVTFISYRLVSVIFVFLIYAINGVFLDCECCIMKICMVDLLILYTGTLPMELLDNGVNGTPIALKDQNLNKHIDNC